MEDRRVGGEPLSASFRGDLTSVQTQAATAVAPYDTGVIVAPPGSGKTVMAASMIARRGVATLVLVHRNPLINQWVGQLSGFLGVPRKEIGAIGGGKRRVTELLDVAMIQSLVKKGVVDDVVSRYGHVVVDECHHVSAVSFDRVLSEVKARYVLGLTATLRRRDGHDPIIEMQLGPGRYALAARAAASGRGVANHLLVRETAFSAEWRPGGSIQDLYAAMAVDPSRNALILGDVLAALEQGRSPLLLTERRDHLAYF